MAAMRTSAFLGSLSGRLLVLGVLPTLVAIGAIVATSALDDYRSLRHAEVRLLDVSVDGAADEVSVHNERWNDLTRAMASAQVDGLFGRRGASLAFSKSVASSSPLILGAYVVYEPDADGRDAASLSGAEVPPGALDSGGRFVPYWYVDVGARGRRSAQAEAEHGHGDARVLRRAEDRVRAVWKGLPHPHGAVPLRGGADGLAHLPDRLGRASSWGSRASTEASTWSRASPRGSAPGSGPTCSS